MATEWHYFNGCSFLSEGSTWESKVGRKVGDLGTLQEILKLLLGRNGESQPGKHRTAGQYY